jgi:hypothetical protein
MPEGIDTPASNQTGVTRSSAPTAALDRRTRMTTCNQTKRVTLKCVYLPAADEAFAPRLTFSVQISQRTHDEGTTLLI